MFKINKKLNVKSANNGLSRQSYFEKLVKEYSSDLYRFAFWLSNNHSISEELVQETFLRAWKALDSLKDENKAKAWLITILRRENFRRFERKSFDFVEIEQDILEDHKNRDPQLHMECIQLYEAILNLEIKYREPLVLQVINGFTSCEISKILKLNINTVNIRLYRARNQLKKIYTYEHFISDYTYRCSVPVARR